MFDAKNINAPEECIDCASCGCHGNGILTIRTYLDINLGGKRVTNRAQMSEIHLCRDCRRKLMVLLWELDEEDEASQHK